MHNFLSTDGTDVSSIERNVAGFKKHGNRNQESVAELFFSLLNKVCLFFQLTNS